LIRSSTFWRAPTADPMFERSKLRVVCARYQPRFSSPMMFAAGTRTSSKNTSLNSCV
jgi:hypothetical protein